MPTLIQTIASTVLDLATPDMKPKALIAAVREKHPEATKSDIVRAAFYAVISHADADPARSDRLQAMAITARSGDKDGPKPKRTRKAKPAADRPGA